MALARIQPKHIALVILGVLMLHVFFDIPGRFYYENRGWDIPSNPVEKAAYDYAHSLKLPDSVPKPTPFYFSFARLRALIPGQPDVSTQYFEHLCRSESGDYIFKTASNVEGIFQMRPRGKVMDKDIDFDRYALEEPTGVGWSNDEGTDDDVYAIYIQPMYGRYLFMERPDWSNDKVITRAIREVNPNPPEGKRNGVHAHIEVTAPEGFSTIRTFYLPWMITYHSNQAKRKARYGYTWRGIKRDLDRRYSIAAGEYLIVNLDTNEVLAVTRRFKLSGRNKTHNSPIWWGNAMPCDGGLINQGPNRAPMPIPITAFVRKVLKPIPHVNDQYVPTEFKSIYKYQGE